MLIVILDLLPPGDDKSKITMGERATAGNERATAG
jgi:hypothetical protein